MRCQECGQPVSFEASDLGDMGIALRFMRHAEDGGWTCRATCPRCKKPTARFQEVHNDE